MASGIGILHRSKIHFGFTKQLSLRKTMAITLIPPRGRNINIQIIIFSAIIVSSIASSFLIKDINRVFKASNKSNIFSSSVSDLDNTMSRSPYRFGFLGCGTIASSIAQGLLRQTEFEVESVAVSRRSESKSSELKEMYPDLVTIYDDNQQILDQADIIFICVLPTQLNDVLEELKFEAGHKIVSLVATSVLADLADLSNLTPSQIYKMICLPSVATLEGTCLLVPKAESQEFKSIFDSLGGTVECKDEKIMNRAMIPCNLMGPLYGIMRNTREWLVDQGMPAEDASYLVARQFKSMVQDANLDSRNPTRFDELIKEQTPGGFNEQALLNLDQLGIFGIYNQTMDALLDRLEGRSDGSIE